jgi:hypothetical protein
MNKDIKIGYIDSNMYFSPLYGDDIYAVKSRLSPPKVMPIFHYKRQQASSKSIQELHVIRNKRITQVNSWYDLSCYLTQKSGTQSCHCVIKH